MTKKPTKERFSLQEEPCMVQGLKSQKTEGPFNPHQTPEIEEELNKEGQVKL